MSLANIDSFDSKIDTIDANVDAILVDTGTTIPAQITALNDPSLTEIVDGVWDEPFEYRCRIMLRQAQAADCDRLRHGFRLRVRL